MIYVQFHDVISSHVMKSMLREGFLGDCESDVWWGIVPNLLVLDTAQVAVRTILREIEL